MRVHRAISFEFIKFKRNGTMKNFRPDISDVGKTITMIGLIGPDLATKVLFALHNFT